MTSILIKSQNNSKNQVFGWSVLIISIFLLVYSKDILAFTSIFLLLFLILLINYKPGIGLLMIIVLSTHSLMFFSYRDLPEVVIGAGLRFNVLDILLIGMFLTGVLKLKKRHERPLFLNIMIIFFIMVTMSFLWSILRGETDLDNGLYTFREMFTYSFYFILVGHIQEKKQFKFLINCVFGLLVISSIIQLYEVLLGTWLPTIGTANVLDRFQGRSIEVSGHDLAYIWNRSVTYSYLALFLSLGAWIIGKSENASSQKKIIFIFLGTLVFLLMLVRVWYIAVFVGIIYVLMSAKVKGKMIVIILSLITIFLVILNYFWASNFYENINIFNLFISRFSTVFAIFDGSAQTFNSRLITLTQQLELFSKNPIWGYGFSKSIVLYTSDIGAGNTLLRFGLIGLIWVISLILLMHSHLKNLLTNLTQDIYKGYVLGMLGALAGIVVAYSFSWDFFTSKNGIFLITVIMALIDRIYIFNKEEITNIKQHSKE